MTGIRHGSALGMLFGFTILLSLHGDPAMAFDSREHCTLSNLALRIALDFAASKSGTSPILGNVKQQLLESRKILSIAEKPESYCFPQRWARPGDFAFSYGKIVALVDYTINPVDLFVSEGSVAEPPAASNQLNEVYFRSKTSISSQLDVASHNNADHFQGSVLYLFDHWHINAMREVTGKRDEPTLFRALANEAIADHFLEDSFAPGHLLTPRSSMSDAMALSWHDAFNDRGRIIAVRNWPALRALDEFSRSHAVWYNKEFQRIGDALPASDNDYASRTTFDAALDELDKPAAAANLGRSCKDKPDWAERFTDPILDPRAKFYNKILDFDAHLLDDNQLGSDAGTTILLCVHGDGSLDEHGRHSRIVIGAQKALMVLVEAKYIEDVIEAFLQSRQIEKRDSLPVAQNEGSPVERARYTWCPIIRSEGTEVTDHQWVDACANILRNAELACRQTSVVDKCKNVHVLPTAITDYFAFVSSWQDSDPLGGGTFDYRDFLYAAHIGAASDNQQVVEIGGLEIGIGLIDEDSHLLNRKSQKPEDDFETSCRFQLVLRNCQLEMALFGGYEFNAGHTSRISNAFTFRGAIEIHSLDFQVGPYFDMDEIGNTALHRWRSGYGARADLGFSLLSFYIALGAEPRFSAPPNTVRTLAISAGVSVIVNGRRISNYFHGRFY